MKDCPNMLCFVRPKFVRSRLYSQQSLCFIALTFLFSAPSEKKTLIGSISPRYQERFDLSSLHLKVKTMLILLHSGQLLKDLI